MNSSSACVGRLAPARPSPTRAGVRCRKSHKDRGGAGVFTGLFGRNGPLAQPYRIIRCILLAARSVAREHDQMMRDQDRTDEIFDLAACKPAPREFPEVPFVVAEHPDLPEDVAQH